MNDFGLIRDLNPQSLCGVNLNFAARQTVTPRERMRWQLQAIIIKMHTSPCIYCVNSYLFRGIQLNGMVASDSHHVAKGSSTTQHQVKRLSGTLDQRAIYWRFTGKTEGRGVGSQHVRWYS